MKCHYTLEWPKSGTMTSSNVARICNIRNSHSFLVGMQNGTTTLEDKGSDIKLNLLPPYNTAVVLTGTYPKEVKVYVHIETCTWTFIAAVFITTKFCEQPRCPLVGEWINKLVNPENGVLFSTK